MQDSDLIKTRVARMRRSYSAAFKSQMVLACKQPGASIAAIARANDVNSNVLHRWLREHAMLGAYGQPAFLPLAGSAGGAVTGAADVCDTSGGDSGNPKGQVRAQAQTQAQATGIEITCRKGATEVSIRWPTAAAQECAQWLAGWLR